MKTTGVIAIFLFLFAAMAFWAEGAEAGRRPKFVHLDITSGLSQNTVNVIYQDSRGFIWLGAQEGLNRYDGAEFKIFYSDPRNPDTIPNSNICALYESPLMPDVLWIGNTDCLCCYDSRQDQFLSHRNSSGFLQSFGGIRARAMVEAPTGVLWLATEGQGLFKIPLKELQGDLHRSINIVHYTCNDDNTSPLPENTIHCLAADKNNVLWMGFASKGMASFNPATGEWKRYDPRTGAKDQKNAANCQIRSLCFARDGRLWIGMNGGGTAIMEKNAAGRELFSCFQPPALPGTGGQRIPSQLIYVVMEDSRGGMWFGARFDGLSLFREKESSYQTFRHSADDPASIISNSIYAIFEDNAGSVWIGTVSGGVSILHPVYRDFRVFPPKTRSDTVLKNKNIWAIVEDSQPGYFWIGAEGGLYRFSVTDETCEPFFNNPIEEGGVGNLSINALLRDSSGEIWLALESEGLRRFKPPGGPLINVENPLDGASQLSNKYIYSILEDREGNIWLGTIGGVNKLNRADRGDPKFINYANPAGEPETAASPRIFCMAEDRNGTIWAGTYGKGLWQYRRDLDVFVAIRYQPGADNTLLDKRVLSLFCSPGGGMWVGGMHGLNYFDALNNRWKSFTTHEGLPNNVIYQIVGYPGDGGENNPNLWISTNRGISCYNPLTGRFKNYNLLDGLQSNEFNKGAGIRTANGLLVFGGIDGFNYFHPRELKDNPNIPPLALIDFQLFNKHVPVSRNGDSPLTESIIGARSIRLAHTENFFSFHFTSLNYIDPEKNRYAYILDGFDKDWVYVDGRIPAAYTSVPPGDYTFRVKSANSEGVWIEKGIEVSVSIRPPFWMTWWFRVLMALLAAGALAMGHKIRTNTIKNRLEKRSLETELRMKADFTAMLVHDLRSPLNAIQAFCEHLDRPEPAEPAQYQKAVRMIFLASGKMLRLISDMLDLSRFEAGKMNIERSSCNLVALLEDGMMLLEPLAVRKNIRFSYRPPDHPQRFSAFLDGEKIAQVINNLLDNALKFSPENGCIVLQLTLFGDNSAELSVTDEGPGVPDNEKARLFDKYAQFNKKHKSAGVGLGLAVSRLIVEAHGGVINYRKPPQGQGSDFYFRIPLLEVPPTSGKEKPSNGEPENAGTENGRS